MIRRINKSTVETYFDAADSAIKIRNYRNGETLIRVSLEDDNDDFIVENERKPEFVKWLKEVIKELEK
jgi:hypothetical protein